MSTFGKTSIGANNDTLPADYIEAFGPFTPATNGTADSMSFYTQIAGITFKLLIFGQTAGAPGALLGKTGDITSVTNGFASGNILVPFSIAAGTNYYLANMQQALITSKSDVGGGTTGYYKNGQIYGTEPNPFPASPTTENNTKSIYVTYTPSADGASVFPQFFPMI
jgi:hypothetical protein